MISYMDEWIGHIYATLEQRGLLDNTIVIHTADHGLAVGQHGLLGKTNLFEHSLRTPLILGGPDIPAGRTSDALVYQHDLFPTLLERAGGKPETGAYLNRSIDRWQASPDINLSVPPTATPCAQSVTSNGNSSSIATLPEKKRRCCCSTLKTIRTK